MTDLDILFFHPGLMRCLARDRDLIGPLNSQLAESPGQVTISRRNVWVGRERRLSTLTNARPPSSIQFACQFVSLCASCYSLTPIFLTSSVYILIRGAGSNSPQIASSLFLISSPVRPRLPPFPK